MLNRRGTGRRTPIMAAVLLLTGSWVLGGAVGVSAQTVDLQPMLISRDVTAMIERDGKLFVGLAGGGVLVADVEVPANPTRWTAGRALSGNDVKAMAWSGRHLWIACLGGGLTRVAEPATAPIFRQYASNLGSLDVSSVTGALVGGSERVYYGMDGGGVGLIVDGLSSSIFTAEQDGLISNDVNDLQIYQGELFVATPVGVSRFANNLFTDQNAGLSNLIVNDLDLDPSGRLVAATNGGLYEWDPGTLQWTNIRNLGAWVVGVTSNATMLAALGLDSQGNGVLHVRDGAGWRVVTLSEPRCAAIHAGTSLWLGGRTVTSTGDGIRNDAYLGRLEAGDTSAIWRQDTASLIQSSEGVAFSADGRAWMGDWFGKAISATDGESWEHLWEAAGAANDSSGIFRTGGNVLSMAADAAGIVWAGQYAVGGLLRHDTATGITRQAVPDNCGLGGISIVNLVTHPDGALIVMHDWVDTEKVEVLADPVHWRGDANWITLPRAGGLGAGPTVWDAVVQRRDVIWFAVEDIGLVRWDVNGDQAGPDDDLTWLDQGDDRWDPPVTSLTGTNLDPSKAVGLAVGADGSIWAGGNGLVQFTYNEVTRVATRVTSVGEKFTALTEGLINGNVADIAVDANEDVWVATRSGLNRVRGTGDDFAVDAWLDLGNYFGNPSYAVLYSPNVIGALTGSLYRKIVADPTGRRLLLSADQGTTLIAVGTAAAGQGSDLAGTYCYPNPWLPDASVGVSGLLKIGGIAVPATGADPATVEIYNLEGQLVYRDRFVTPDTGFWDGTNRLGKDVTSGMYVLKVAWHEFSTALTLAVVR